MQALTQSAQEPICATLLAGTAPCSPSATVGTPAFGSPPELFWASLLPHGQTSLQAVSELTISISFFSPHGAVVKHSPASAGDTGDTRWIPGSRRPPEEENNPLQYSLIARLVKSLPAMQETVVRFLGREDPTWTSLVVQLVKTPPSLRETWV